MVSHPRFSKAGLPLRQLLPEAEWIGLQDLAVHRVVSDPREVRPGDVWVAVGSRKKATGNPLSYPKGSQVGTGIAPPHGGVLPEEAALAVARRAAAVVAETPLPGLPIPQVVVPDVREAWGRICQALAGHPSKTLKVVAVTGRLGVTPTCWLLRRVLAEAGYQPGLLTPQGRFDGKHWKLVGQDISGPDTLAERLAQMLDCQCTHAVIEVSPRALAEKHLAGMDLDVVCLAPFGRKETLGRGKSTSEQQIPPTVGRSAESASGGRQSKDQNKAPNRSPCPSPRPHPRVAALQEGLFQYLTPEGLTVLSADDPLSAEWLPFLEGPVLTVGVRRMAEITARLLEQQLAEQTFLLQAGTDVTPVRTRRIGNEHIISCLLAAAVGLAYGIELAPVVRALELVESVPGHLERIERGQPFGVFLEAARNGVGLCQGLGTLKRLCEGRLWCVAGLGMNQQKKADLFQRVLPRYVDRLLLTVESFSQGVGQAKEPACVRAVRERFAAGQALWFPDRGEAIWTALQQAEAGDCVVVLCSREKTSLPAANASSDWADRQMIQGCLECLYPEELPLTG